MRIWGSLGVGDSVERGCGELTTLGFLLPLWTEQERILVLSEVWEEGWASQDADREDFGW